MVVVAGRLGHASPSTTANIYAHVIASADAKATEVASQFDDIVNLRSTPEKPPASGTA